jgi:hypothetical protein
MTEITTLANNKLVIRMSESGHCVRALTAQYSGKYEDVKRPIPTWLEEAANEGKMHEIWIKAQMRDNFDVFDEQLELKIEQDNFILLGHIDGKCVNLETNTPIELLEIKSMSEYEFQRWMHGKFEAFPQYASQLACYVTATGLNDVRYIVKNRSSGYKDINILNDNFPVAENYDKILRKCEAIYQHLQDNTLPEVEYNGTSLECKRCFYDKLCIPPAEDLVFLDDGQLRSATIKYREAVTKMEEWKQIIDEQKKIFRNQLEKARIKKFTSNWLAVQLIEVKPRIDYPKKNLLSVFTEEELRGCESVKEGYSFLRIDDKQDEKMEYKKAELDD